MHQKIANATFQVVSGNSFGSGFSFINENYVITNYHVVSNMVNLEEKKALGLIKLRCEDNQLFSASIIHINIDCDFAVLKIESNLPEGREILQPAENFIPIRGLKLIFTGYPHGENHLLSHEGIISSPLPDGRFHIDGMVSGGNSGGPIVDLTSGKVIGIVSERRFIGSQDIKNLRAATNVIIQQCENLRQAGTIISSGFNVADLNQAYATGLTILTAVLESNANPGIAIGYPITPVVNAIKEIKI
ncbi:S1 family peptidase [Enterobacter cloacae]|uniref:Serine protease n=1 Tax=Enterobacter cloacae TaxID=550 RepID=A0A3R8Z9Y3_ENTCL|nr:serine protease [Enterobacter cloacae]RSB23631.1 serine protease [Enterobacter cloacae]